MAFERMEFYRICMDIEKYLGYLRANELAADYLKALDAQQPEGDYAELYQRYHVSLRDWRTPCPEGKYKAAAIDNGGLASGVVLLPFDASDADKRRVDKEVRDYLDVAWNNGVDWADGLAMYMNSVCAQFSHVDVDSMASAIVDLVDGVVSELSVGARSQWTSVGKMLHKWEGEGATNFFLFHDNYGSALTQFAHMTAQVGGGFAAATYIVAGTQEAAMKFVESVREALEIMLVFYVECGLIDPPTPNFDIDVAKVLRIAGGAWKLLGLLPPLKGVKSGVDTVATAVGAITTVAKEVMGEVDVEPYIEPHRFTDWSANGLYSEITRVLHDEIYLKYVEAMESLHSGDTPPDIDNADDVPFRAKKLEDLMLRMQGGRNEWELPDVPPKPLNENGASYGW